MTDILAGGPTRLSVGLTWLMLWRDFWPLDLREQWVWADCPHNIGGARSVIIDLAKHGGRWKGKDYKPLGKGGLMFQNDTDVASLIPYEEVLAIVKEDVNAGWGLVCAPTVVMVANEGKPQFHPKGAMFSNKPFEVDMAGFGLIAMPEWVLAELEPYDEVDNMGGQKIPIYCSWNSSTGEDIDLIRRVAKIAPVCVDPRLPTRQEKTAWFEVGGVLDT